jgi:hypothetical protein
VRRRPVRVRARRLPAALIDRAPRTRMRTDLILPSCWVPGMPAWIGRNCTPAPDAHGRRTWITIDDSLCFTGHLSLVNCRHRVKGREPVQLRLGVKATQVVIRSHLGKERFVATRSRKERRSGPDGARRRWAGSLPVHGGQIHDAGSNELVRRTPRDALAACRTGTVAVLTRWLHQAVTGRGSPTALHGSRGVSRRCCSVAAPLAIVTATPERALDQQRRQSGIPITTDKKSGDNYRGIH